MRIRSQTSDGNLNLSACMEPMEHRLLLSGNPQTLVNFNVVNGSGPQGGLTIDQYGDLFGTTVTGGVDSDGIVFEIPAGTNNVVTVASFNGSDGSDPIAKVTLDSSGDVYGSTETGGANGEGVIFEVPATTAGRTALAASLKYRRGPATSSPSRPSTAPTAAVPSRALFPMVTATFLAIHRNTEATATERSSNSPPAAT